MASLDERSAIISLHLADGIGPLRLRNLCAHFGSAAAALAADERDLTAVEGVSTVLARRIRAANRPAGPVPTRARSPTPR